ncbi:MAG: DNA mismatch repair endonuclease MutL, partial [Acidobacteria bacterium]|nr:DNA mismatch repair endonuclease MutL [Acidobacteriota bacterium]
ALLAFERHATSKLRTPEDLLSIATMGFRGEALPSVAAVSRLVLETRSQEEQAGTRVEIAGGRLLKVLEAGLPVGTSVTVSSLFYNTPARRKFLRSESTELSHITSLITHYALAYPEKSFLLRTQSGEAVNVTPVVGLRERVFQVFGGDVLEDLVEFGPCGAQVPAVPPEETEEAGTDEPESVASRISLRGFLSRPQLQKLNRNSIYTFVNRRQIRDRVLLHAIQEAYRNILPGSCFPAVLLFLEMPCAEVDVNVHPSKTEVRFRHQQFIHDLVREALRDCLAASKPISTFPLGATTAPLPPYEKAESTPPETREIRFPRSARFPREDQLHLTPPPLPPQEQALPLNVPESFSSIPASAGEDGQGSAEGTGEALAGNASAELAELRPLGQVRESFIVAASASGLWLIDQHVAHERVLFERLLEQWGSGATESQRLLLPHIQRLSPSQSALWNQIAQELAAAGFEAEPFGQNTVAVKAVPAGVKSEQVERLLNEILENMEKESRALSPEAVRHKVAASVACHAAIKVNTPLDQPKMEWLLGELAATRHPMSCPHGRPVVLKYGMKEILKAFQRI